jgi:RNA polymerase sigma-70 factor (ECF subfamily)
MNSGDSDVTSAPSTQSLPVAGNWKAWLDEHGPRLLLFARQQTRSQEDAEDILQDALVKLVEKLESGQFSGGQEAWMPYLYTTLRRLSIDLGRRDDRRKRREDVAHGGIDEEREEGEHPWFAGDDSDDEMRLLIEAGLKELPEKFSEVIVMKVWGERTFAEIGEALEISQNTAASRGPFDLTMDDDIHKLEAEMTALRPSSLDPDFMGRLLRTMEGRAAELGPVDRAYEHELRSLKPTPLRPSARAACMETLGRLPFPGGSTVVPFPVAARPKPASRRRRVSWAAAAAVALAGGLSALLVGPKDRAPVAHGEPAPRIAPTVPTDSAAFSPASFASGVSGTDDLGRVWAGRERAVRVVKVTYKDRVVWTNEHGEEVVTEVPRVEYLVVPEKVD